jgi:hypothetical protein
MSERRSIEQLRREARHILNHHPEQVSRLSLDGTGADTTWGMWRAFVERRDEFAPKADQDYAAYVVRTDIEPELDRMRRQGLLEAAP